MKFAAVESELAEKCRGLRVALVHDWLTGMRGGEKVLEVIADLFPEAPIFTLFCFEDAISAKLKSHPIKTSFIQSLPGVRKHHRHFLPLFPQAIESFDLTGFDLIISTSHCVAKGLIPGPGALHLCYCHSPMRYAWDLEHQYFPERRGFIAQTRGLFLHRLRLWDAASCPRVDHFWANSTFVAQRIGRYYGRSAEVLPPPVDLDFFRARSEKTLVKNEESPDNAIEAFSGGGLAAESSKSFALAVSALVPYKRLDLAIQACERLDLELRIVGIGPEDKRLRRLAGPRTKLLGRVEPEELRSLYREARFFLQPGKEDFGIATVEALAAGTPVVAQGQGGVRDIVVDGEHGVLYHGNAVENLMAAIDKFLKIKFNSLKLVQRSEEFSTERFVQRLCTSLSQWLDRASVLPEGSSE